MNHDINNVLSDEVLLNIFSFLDGNDLLICNCVCKRWNRVTEEESLWNNILQAQCPLLSFKVREAPHDRLHKSFVEIVRTAQNWNKNQPKQITLEGHSDGVTCFDIIVDENTNHTRIISGSADTLIVIWDLGCDQYNIMRTKVLHPEFEDTITSIQYLPTKKWIIASSLLSTKILNMDGAVLASIDVTDSGAAEFISCGDAYYVIRASPEWQYFMNWKITEVSGQLRCELVGQNNAMQSVTEIRQFKIPGKSGLFLTGCSNGSIEMWNVRGNCLASATMNSLFEPGPVNQLVVSQNLIAVGYYASGGVFQCEFSGEDSAKLSLLLQCSNEKLLVTMALEGGLPQGAAVAMAFYSIVQVYTSQSEWSHVLQLKGHAGPVTSIKFDDTKFVTGSVDRTVRVWNWKGECLRVFSGQLNKINKVDFIRNLLVCSSGDGTLVVQNYDNPVITIPNPAELITTPEKLAKRIELANTEKANNQSTRLVVLVLTGAFSPIHLDHVRVLEHAKKFMESNGHLVVAGILSPANDSYGKMGLISARHRLKMVELAIEDIDWMLVSKWECTNSKFRYPYEVLDHIEDYLKNQLHCNLEISVMYLCGDDVPPRMTSYMDKITSHGMVVAPRSAEEFMKILPTLTKHPENIYVMDSWQPSKASSTQIRDRIQKGEALSDLTFPVVEKYIKENHLF